MLDVFAFPQQKELTKIMALGVIVFGVAVLLTTVADAVLATSAWKPDSRDVNVQCSPETRARRRARKTSIAPNSHSRSSRSRSRSRSSRSQSRSRSRSRSGHSRTRKRTKPHEP